MMLLCNTYNILLFMFYREFDLGILTLMPPDAQSNYLRAI